MFFFIEILGICISYIFSICICCLFERRTFGSCKLNIPLGAIMAFCKVPLIYLNSFSLIFYTWRLRRVLFRSHPLIFWSPYPAHVSISLFVYLDLKCCYSSTVRSRLLPELSSVAFLFWPLLDAFITMDWPNPSIESCFSDYVFLWTCPIGSYWSCAF